MNPSDWNDPRIRRLGAEFAAEAYDLASELHGYGADAAQLLLSWKEQDPDRPPDVCIPAAFADTLMALLLSLPRPHLGRPRSKDAPLRAIDHDAA
jgi:hypothetical protein